MNSNETKKDAAIELPVELPVTYAPSPDAHIYNRDGIVADLYEIATGLGVDDSGIGTKEYDEFRDSAGEYIAKCINEHEQMKAELTSLRSPWVRIESEADLPPRSVYVLAQFRVPNGRYVVQSWEPATDQNSEWFMKTFSKWMRIPTDSNKDAAGVEGE